MYPTSDTVTPKKCTRKGRPVRFLRCKSRDRSKSSLTFTESTRRLFKKLAAGEAPIQKGRHLPCRWALAGIGAGALSDPIPQRPVFP